VWDFSQFFLTPFPPPPPTFNIEELTQSVLKKLQYFFYKTAGETSCYKVIVILTYLIYLFRVYQYQIAQNL